jgi:ABC-2 type transport system permease protein
MDLIFSTPITRERYVLEKFAAMIIIVIFVLLVAAGAMASGVDSIGETDNLGSSTIFLAVIGSLPMLLVIMAFGYLAAFQFRSTRVGMGLTFLFVMVEFILFTVAQLVSSLEYLKYASIMHYWDYNTVLYDVLFKVGDFVVLFVTTGIILLLAVWVFKKKDIPA